MTNTDVNSNRFLFSGWEERRFWLMWNSTLTAGSYWPLSPWVVGGGGVEFENCLHFVTLTLLWYRKWPWCWCWWGEEEWPGGGGDDIRLCCDDVEEPEFDAAVTSCRWKGGLKRFSRTPSDAWWTLWNIPPSMPYPSTSSALWFILAIFCRSSKSSPLLSSLCFQFAFWHKNLQFLQLQLHLNTFADNPRFDIFKLADGT